MMELVGLGLSNLLSPVILFFLIGILAAAMRSDLEIPTAIGKFLSLYLLIAIGFKGGVELAHSEWTAQLVLVGVTAIALSFLMPWFAKRILAATTRLSSIDASAVAAAYGSVSAVTFVTAVAFLTGQGTPFSGYLVAALALMETPAVVSGLLLAGSGAGKARISRAVLHEAFTSGSVVLLIGALLVGLATGDAGMEQLGSFLVEPFNGILAIFLLDMGLIVVRRLSDVKMEWRLVAFGLYMPLIGATIGLLLAWLIGLSAGDATLLAVLAGSASYIAVPAAMRQALPKANPSLYVTLSLGVTFPFNVIVGIPIYYTVATMLMG